MVPLTLSTCGEHVHTAPDRCACLLTNCRSMTTGCMVAVIFGMYCRVPNCD
jgi:hypothetical protein